MLQKAPQTLPQTLPKRLRNSISSYNARNPKKMQPSHTKPSFFRFPDSRKSSQNPYQNAFKISFILATLLEPQKIRFMMLKPCQDGPHNFQIFSKIVQKPYFARPLIQDASQKTLRASHQPSRACQERPKRRPRAFTSLPTASNNLHTQHLTRHT